MADFAFGPQDKSKVIGLNPTNIGEFSSASVGASASNTLLGIPISSTRSKALDVCADDGGVALTAGEFQGTRSRVLLTKAITAAVTVSATRGQLKISGVSVAGDNRAGVCGYLEVANAGTIAAGGVATGVWGRVDCPSGCTIGASAVLSAFAAQATDLGGTHTGIAAVLNVPAPGTGSWDSLINVSSTSGVYSTSVGAAATKYLTVSVDRTPYKIALYAVS
jgi:hypothetical protein